MGVLVINVDQCPARPGFGAGEQEEERGRGEKVSNEGERVAIVVRLRSE